MPRLVPSDPLPAGAGRSARVLAHGAGPPALARTPGPALLAAAGNGPRPDDDTLGRSAPLGAVRGLGGRRPRSTPSWPDRPWPRDGRAGEAYTVRLAPLQSHGALGRQQPARRPGGAPDPGGPVAILTRAAIRPARAVALLPRDRATRARAARGAGAAGVGRASARRRCCARRRSRSGRSLRATRPRTPTAATPPRGDPAHARRAAGTARSCSRAFAPTAPKGMWDGRDPLAHRHRLAGGGAAAERDERQPAARVNGPAREPEPAEPSHALPGALERTEPPVRRRAVDRAAGGAGLALEVRGVRDGALGDPVAHPEPVDQRPRRPSRRAPRAR